MGSKGRIPPHHRRPLSSPGMLHPDLFSPGIHLPPGALPYDMLPPLEVMEQKAAAQHVEMQKLAFENQRLASTHSSLRHELAAAQQDLHRLQVHMDSVKADQDQQTRMLREKIAKMEADLKASEAIKVELHQAHGEAQNLMAVRQELIVKVQKMTQDLQRSHGDVQQVPALISELESLRQEYQHYRATYDYERKLRLDHYESLQVMEKNYVSMVREVEKLRAELTNSTNIDRSGAPYSANTGHKENDASGHHSVGQNAYEDGFGVSQARGLPGGAIPHSGAPTGIVPPKAGFDAPRGTGYDSARLSGYEASRAAGYDASRGGSYEVPRGTSHEASRGSGYDASQAVGAQVAAASANNPPQYGSTQAPSPYGAMQAPSVYGSTQAPTAYALSQGPSPYGPTQPLSYESGQTLTYSGGAYEAAAAPRPNAARR